MTLSELKIIEPIKNYLKEFETVDEFNLYYAKHKDEIDELTTHKLNKMYHINGYRITKIKGILMLKKWDSENKTKNNANNQEIEEIKETVNSIINFLKNTFHEQTIVSPPSTT